MTWIIIAALAYVFELSGTLEVLSRAWTEPLQHVKKETQWIPWPAGLWSAETQTSGCQGKCGVAIGLVVESVRHLLLKSENIYSCLGKS